MRFLILIALCLAVASATNTNRNRFNRLLRNLQSQQENGLYESQGLSYEQDNDQYDDNQDDDEDDDYQQQQQCSRGLGMDNDDEESQCGPNQDCDEQDDDDCMTCQPGQSQRQCRQQQQQCRRQQQQQQHGPQQSQQKRQQQQRHQCQPKHQLLQELEQPNCRLAAKLYKQAKQENDDKNTVVSPAAVQLALAAIQRGARGQTKRQLQRVCGAQLNQKQQQQAAAALQQTLQGQQQGQGQRQQNQRGQQQQQAQVKTTTTIIINQNTRAQQKFVQAVKVCQNAQVKQCNFQRQPQQCRQQINRYIAQKTNQKLQQVVPQQAITENTKMIVVNTAQLKARWGQQFRQQQQTKQGNFYPLGTQQPKQVQVLQSQGQFNYYEDDQLQVVGIPTQRQELTLYVIVPKDKDGLTEIEKQQIQNGQQLKQLLNQAEQQQEQIDLELPKFQIKHKIDAKQTLRQQGAQAPFDADEADLSGINGQHQGQQQQQQSRRRQQQWSEDEDDQQSQYDQDEQGQQGQQQQGQQLHVNKLIHQCTIKIDEQGISAARPGRQQQQQQHHQYQQQDQQDEYDQEDGDDEDQQEQYEQQQLSRRQTYQDVFGRRNHRRNQQQNGGQGRKVKVNRAFAFAIKHNQSNQIVMVGRVVDATQKPTHQQQQWGRQQQQQQQSLNGVDQE